MADIVPPAASGRQQRLQVVQHEKDAVLFQQFRQTGQPGGELFSAVHQVGHLQARELLFHVQGQVEQRALDVAALVGGLVPDKALEAAALVAVGQFQGTGRLACPGHAVEEDARLVDPKGGISLQTSGLI